MGDKLRPKYRVQRITGEKPDVAYWTEGPIMLATDPNDPDSPFVLMPRKDPAAYVAMVTYAHYCEPQLAGQIRAWLRSIAEKPPVYGSQGTFNWRFIKQRLADSDD